jgi:hypothetical protein
MDIHVLNVKRVVLGHAIVSIVNAVPPSMQRVCHWWMADLLCPLDWCWCSSANDVLTDLDLKYFLRICKELGLTTLIEVWHMLHFHYSVFEGPCMCLQKTKFFVWFKVHDEREMERVLKIDGVQLIGINIRCLGMRFFWCSLCLVIGYILLC